MAIGTTFGEKQIGKAAAHLFSRGVLPLLLHLLVPEPLPLEVGGVAGDGVVLLIPVPDLVDRSVGRAVVRGRVMTDAVGHGLDQDGAGLAEGDLPEEKREKNSHMKRWRVSIEGLFCRTLCLQCGKIPKGIRKVRDKVRCYKGR